MESKRQKQEEEEKSGSLTSKELKMLEEYLDLLPMAEGEAKDKGFKKLLKRMNPNVFKAIAQDEKTRLKTLATLFNEDFFSAMVFHCGWKDLPKMPENRNPEFDDPYGDEQEDEEEEAEVDKEEEEANEEESEEKQMMDVISKPAAETEAKANEAKVEEAKAKEAKAKEAKEEAKEEEEEKESAIFTVHDLIYAFKHKNPVTTIGLRYVDEIFFTVYSEEIRSLLYNTPCVLNGNPQTFKEYMQILRDYGTEFCDRLEKKTNRILKGLDQRDGEEIRRFKVWQILNEAKPASPEFEQRMLTSMLSRLEKIKAACESEPQDFLTQIRQTRALLKSPYTLRTIQNPQVKELILKYVKYGEFWNDDECGWADKLFRARHRGRNGNLKPADPETEDLDPATDPDFLLFTEQDKNIWKSKSKAMCVDGLHRVSGRGEGLNSDLSIFIRDYFTFDDLRDALYLYNNPAAVLGLKRLDICGIAPNAQGPALDYCDEDARLLHLLALHPFCLSSDIWTRELLKSKLSIDLNALQPEARGWYHVDEEEIAGEYATENM